MTAGTTEAASTNISTYNAFALAQADTAPALVALNTSWMALGSTDTTSAISNAGTSGTGVPIYALNGNLIAANYSALWGGGIDNPIQTTQNDTTSTTFPWTGSTAGGASRTPYVALGDGSSELGSTIQTDYWWIEDGDDIDTDARPMYALSGVLTVTPEPGSAALLALGAGVLLGWRRRSA